MLKYLEIYHRDAYNSFLKYKKVRVDRGTVRYMIQQNYKIFMVRLGKSFMTVHCTVFLLLSVFENLISAREGGLYSIADNTTDNVDRYFK